MSIRQQGEKTLSKLKVLIVDDSILYRKILSAAVEKTGVAIALQTASNGNIAIDRIQQNSYDVVLLDVNMPEKDGIETLLEIKDRYPKLPVIMVSSTGGNNADITIKALQMGAMDFIIKPVTEDYESNMKFVSNKLKILFAQVRLNRLEQGKKPDEAMLKIRSHEQQSLQQSTPLNVARSEKLSGIDVVVIAASTGGPVALGKIFESVSKDFTKPILIVQHMPAEFTKALADTLDKKGSLPVIEGKAGIMIRAGQTIIAPGGFHMLAKNSGKHAKMIALQQTDYVHGVRPSADVLFDSVAEVYAGANVLAIILTGMGSDGVEGVKKLKKKCRCYCIAQSEETCVVYGMPRRVVDAGLHDEILDIAQIAKRMKAIADGRR